MARLRIELDVPEEVLSESQRDEFVTTMRKHAVLDLLRAGRLSQSKAAGLLGVTRDELFDLMSREDVPHMNFRPGDVERHAAAFVEAYRRNSV